jgi:nitroreductase
MSTAMRTPHDLFEAWSQILQNRVSIRDFESQVLELPQILEVLRSAARAPSSKNSQPWFVDYVSGETLAALKADYLAAFDGDLKTAPDYAYGPAEQPGEWKARARQVGFALFAHKGIGREDKDLLREHYRANYAFFDAPQVLFLSVHKDAGPGNHMDCGMFLANLLGGITAKGWGACPSFAAVTYPEILRRHIPNRQDTLFLCGIPLGIPSQAPVNDFRTVREEPETWLQILNGNSD